MGMEDFATLLDDLATAFYEPALWQGKIIPGRYRVDPYDVATGEIEPGLGTSQTWFWCNRARIQGREPELGDYLVIRGERYEIAQRDEPDDLGEIGYRLIKCTIGPPPFAASVPPEAAPRPMPLETHGIVGRPTRRAEIVAAYADARAAGDIASATSLALACRIVRERLVGVGVQGLGERTLRRILGPLHYPRGGNGSIRGGDPARSPSLGGADLIAERSHGRE